MATLNKDGKKEFDEKADVDVLTPFTITHHSIIDATTENKKMNHTEITPVSFYFLKKVPGSEDVFRRIQKASANDPDAWWRDLSSDSDDGKKEEEEEEEELDEEDEVSDEKEE